MPTYLYRCKAKEDNHGEFEYDHSINDKLVECPHCLAAEKHEDVERLIAGGSNFILQGSNWASTGYSG